MTNMRGQFQVEFLKSVRANGGRIAAARFSLQRDPDRFKFIDPVYSLTLEQQGGRSLQELPWTFELEEYLLELGCKTEPGDEAERFAIILLNNLRTAEESYGKDYARAVLIDLLRERPEYELEAWLVRVRTPRPSQSSAHYADCTRFLDHSIAGLQNTAILGLHYEPEEAKSLIRDALGIVLDETFYISATDKLFPKRA